MQFCTGCLVSDNRSNSAREYRYRGCFLGFDAKLPGIYVDMHLPPSAYKIETTESFKTLVLIY
jgi:hypothetical protein